MKKMLAKAVVLGLVLGGIGFVANDAQAAKIGDGVEVFSGASIGLGYDVKTETALKKDTALAEQKDLVEVNKEATAAQTTATAAQTTANAAQTTANAAQTTATAAQTTANAAQTTATAAQAAAAKNADDIKTNADNIEANSKAISVETDARKAEVARLDSKIDKLDARVEKVGAMAAAIANLHTMGYDPEAPTEIAVGVGQYRDKTGMALGAFHYPNRDFMLSFSVSTAGDEYMGGIGATWKFGRKTPEELRQAEAEKAAKAKLAKAEAAKKAAKDARVAAQQKRHAEMLAARTAK